MKVKTGQGYGTLLKRNMFLVRFQTEQGYGNPTDRWDWHVLGPFLVCLLIKTIKVTNR